VDGKSETYKKGYCSSILKLLFDVFFFFLVGGAIAILKNMKVNGCWIIPSILWKIIQMFETTNQIGFGMIDHL